MSEASAPEQKPKSRPSAVLPWLMLLVIVVLSLLAIFNFLERFNQLDDLNQDVRLMQKSQFGPS